MTEAENKQLIPQEEHAKKPIISAAKQIIGKTLSPLRGGDTHKLIEEFTSEVSLVAEGLSEDQERLSRLLDNVAASQTTFENDTLEKLEALDKSVKGLSKQIKALEEKQEKLEKAAQEKKERKTDSWTRLIRQLTWLAGIVAGAWIVVTFLKAIL